MPATNLRKVAIIGCGFVGSATAFSLMESGMFSEMALIDVDRDRAEGEALDIAHGTPFMHRMKIYAGTYDDISDASIVVMTAGSNQKPGETRLDLVNKNVRILMDVLTEIRTRNYQGILLLVANPVDILTYIATKYSRLPASHVFGSGTVLDSARFKTILGTHLGVAPSNVHARIIGEHGDSEFPVWSMANISGIPIRTFFAYRNVIDPDELMANIELLVRNSAYEIIKRKRATNYGIASTVRHICGVITRDEKSIMTVTTVLEGEYGISDVALSVPTIVGRKGAEFRVPAPISTAEKEHLQASAHTLRSIIDTLDLPELPK